MSEEEIDLANGEQRRIREGYRAEISGTRLRINQGAERMRTAADALESLFQGGEEYEEAVKALRALSSSDKLEAHVVNLRTLRKKLADADSTLKGMPGGA